MKKIITLLSLMLVLSTTALLAGPPAWTAPTNMQYNMQVIAKLQVAAGPIYSNSSSDIIGAFVNSAVRGVASPGVDGYIYLTINSDAVSGESIDLQAYISVDDVIYPVTVYPSATDALNGTNEVTDLQFSSNAILGSYAAPYVFVASPATWTITPSVGTGAMTGTISPAIATTVVEGASQSFTMEPATGYHFVSVLINDGTGSVDVFDANQLENDGSFIYEFSNITKDWTIQANFAINTYTLIFNAGNNGTLSGPDPANAPGGDLVTVSVTGASQLLYEDIPYGTSFGVVTAVANANYEFAAWSDDENALAARPAISVSEDITTTATFVPSGWDPDDNYQFTMIVIGNLVIDGSISTNTNDLVGAFVGGDCRGVASPDANGLVYLSIGSNAAAGEEVNLRIWDSNTGNDCDASYPLTFLSNDQIGTISNPYVIECQIELRKAIPAGYTWFSGNIETSTGTTAWNPNTYFQDAWFESDYSTTDEPTVNDRIIGQTAFAVYANTGAANEWVGSLTNMSPKKMYRLFLNNPLYLKLVGSAVENSAITLNSGYTWLGYIPRENLPIAEALANFSGLVANDRIIGQTSFAIYNGATWQGSMTRLYPGRGYIIQMANGGTLTYPAYQYSRSSDIMVDEVASPAGFKVNGQMKNTMMVVGKFDEPNMNANDVLYAFIDGECRGMAKTSDDGNIYLSVGENSEEAKEISFKVWVEATGELADIDQTLTFEPLKAVGDLENPYKFSIAESNPADSWLVGEAYPNPFNNQTVIPLWLKETAKVSVNVYNNMGQLVRNIHLSASKTGPMNIVVKKDDLQNGIYYYTLTIQSDLLNLVENGKLIVQ